MSRGALALALALAPAPARAAPFRVASSLGSSMVLDAARPLLWGFAPAGATVTASLDGGPPLPAVADAAGVWRVTLPAPPPASLAPHTLSFASAGAPGVDFTDVLFGRVFLCSGQSNMALPLVDIFNASAEIAAADIPGLRLYHAPICNASAEAAEACAAAPLPWARSSPAVAGGFSALCFLTARDLFAALGGATPVGAMVAAVSGTAIQLWTPRDATDACAALRGPTPPEGAACNTPGNLSCLYDGMVAPLALGPVGLSGVLFMQGEQDTANLASLLAGYYECALRAMIRAWRTRLAQPDLWFGVYVLQPWTWDDDTLPVVRLSQVAVAATEPRVASASCIDTGDFASPFTPVHTRDKQTPARRMAAAAAATLFDVPGAPWVGPTYAGARAAPARGGALKVTVAFAPASLAGGLALNASAACPAAVAAHDARLCGGFDVGTGDGAWHAAAAALGADGASLELTVAAPPAGAVAAATRGYYAAWPVVSLRNGAGLPAVPWLANITA